MPLASGEISPDLLGSALTGQNLANLALGWARALPVAVIVPAFGLPGTPGMLRVAIALSLGATGFTVNGPALGSPNVVTLVGAVLQGTALAITAAAGLWVATMAGGLYEELAVDETRAEGEFFDSRRPASTLLGFLAAIAFLSQGGPSRLALAMAGPVDASEAAWRSVAGALTAGIGLAVALAAPLVSAAVLVQTSMLVLVRQSPNMAAQSLVHVLRGFFRLLVLAIFLEWLTTALAKVVG